MNPSVNLLDFYLQYSNYFNYFSNMKYIRLDREYWSSDEKLLGSWSIPVIFVVPMNLYEWFVIFHFSFLVHNSIYSGVFVVKK